MSEWVSGTVFYFLNNNLLNRVNVQNSNTLTRSSIFNGGFMRNCRFVFCSFVGKLIKN